MRVSVIIPAFNRKKTIRRAVESVLAQSYKPIELIVVDDGSVDGTAEELSEFGSRLRVIKQPNAGPSAARNTGIRAATGDLVAFLDSDDAWLPEKLARQISLLNQAPQAVCCICNATMLYPNGERRTSFEAAGLHPRHSDGVWTNPAEVLLTRFLLFNQVVVVRREVLTRAGYFPATLRIMEDYDLALRLAAAGHWAFSAEPLVIWHGGAENSLSSNVRGNDIPAITYEILTGFCRTPSGAHIKSHPLMRRRLFVLRHRAKAIELTRDRSPLRRLAGVIWLQIPRFFEATFNRLPSAPQMETRPA